MVDFQCTVAGKTLFFFLDGEIKNFRFQLLLFLFELMLILSCLDKARMYNDTALQTKSLPG